MPRPVLRMLDSGPVLVLAVIAGAGSFTHIHDTAAEHGQGGAMAWAIAVCVDLTCVMAARERQRDKKAGRRRRGPVSWPTLVLGGGVVLSLAANLAQADPSVWGRIVAATPAGAFLVAVSMLERRSSGSRADAEGAEGSPVTAPSVRADGSRYEAASILAVGVRPRPEPSTEAGGATPRTAHGAGERASGASLDGAERPLPDDLVAFARRVAADHHTRRGSPISADALRARMGVSASLAADLHQLVTTERSPA